MKVMAFRIQESNWFLITDFSNAECTCGYLVPNSGTVYSYLKPNNSYYIVFSHPTDGTCAICLKATNLISDAFF